MKALSAPGFENSASSRKECVDVDVFGEQRCHLEDWFGKYDPSHLKTLFRKENEIKLIFFFFIYN